MPWAYWRYTQIGPEQFLWFLWMQLPYLTFNEVWGCTRLTATFRWVECVSEPVSHKIIANK